MRTLLTLSDRFVATIVSILLTLFAQFVFFVRLDATFVVALLSFSLGFHATALTGESGAGGRSNRKRYGKSDNYHW